MNMKTAEVLVEANKKEMLSVTPDTTIYDTIQKMVSNKTGSILVKEDEKIVGIWTERDYLRDTVSKGFNPYTASIKDYMQRKIFFANHDENVYQLMDKFLGLRIRHLPIKKNGEVIGLLSSGDVLKELLKNKDEELEKIQKRLSWEYHEDWKW